MAKKDETYCEYRGNVAVIHLGADLLERFEYFAEEAANHEGTKTAVIDLQDIDQILSREAGQFIVANDHLTEKKIGMYICNLHSGPKQVLEMLGVTALPNLYVKGDLEETLAELAKGKQK